MSQLANGLFIKGAPKFTDYVVPADTWKEKPNTDVLRTDDGDGAVYNYTSWKPGVDATCDLMIKLAAGASAVPEKLDVLAALAPDSRSFIILDFTVEYLGGKPVKLSGVQLAYHEGFTPTVVDEDPA